MEENSPGKGAVLLLVLAVVTAGVSLLLTAIDMGIKRQVLEEAAALRKEINLDRSTRATRAKPAGAARRVPASGGDPRPAVVDGDGQQPG